MADVLLSLLLLLQFYIVRIASPSLDMWKKRPTILQMRKFGWNSACFFRCQAGIDFNAAIHLEPFNVQVRAGVDNKSDMMMNVDE